MANISNVQKVATGDKLEAGYFNGIAAALMDAGYVDLPEVSSVPVDAASKASAAVGYVAYAKTVDGVATVFFADEAPADAEAIIGIVVSVAGGKVTLIAPEDATVDAAHKESLVYTTWGDFFGETYASSVGSYDADGNKLSDETEGVEGAVFTIKSSGSSTNIKKLPDDADFQADFGTATSAQRTLAMSKLHGFAAAALCHKYNPKASVINMKGLWYLPVVGELDLAYQSRADIYSKISKYGVGVQTYGSYWSCLENAGTSAWCESLKDGSTDYGNKYSNYFCRAFCVL